MQHFLRMSIMIKEEVVLVKMPTINFLFLRVGKSYLI